MNSDNTIKNKEELYRKKVLRNYIITCIFLICLSFLGLLFKEWIVPICVTVCSIFGTLVTILLLRTHSDATSEYDRGRLTIYMLFRYACMIVGIVISGLIVKFTMGEEVNKLRYIIVVVAAIPYIAPTISLLFTRVEE